MAKKASRKTTTQVVAGGSERVSVTFGGKTFRVTPEQKASFDALPAAVKAKMRAPDEAHPLMSAHDMRGLQSTSANSKVERSDLQQHAGFGDVGSTIMCAF